jgi:hypothetical protein
MDNFVTTLESKGRKAVVEYDVRGSYLEAGGKRRTFVVRKRLRLVNTGKEWKIDCEEDAKYILNTKGNVTNECQIK